MGGLGDSQYLFDPGQALFDNALGEDHWFSESYNTAADPLDIWGNRAEETRDQISDIARGSAQAGIDAQEEMRQILMEYLEPYRTAAAGALPGFQQMATGGGTANALSPEYRYQRALGTRNINRQLSAQGRRHSSYGGERMGSFLNALGQEEAGRQYGRNLDAIKMGQGALQTLGGVNQAAAGAGGQMYGNLGNVLNANMQNYGAQRRDSLYQGANALQGLGSWMEYRGG